MRDNPHGSLRIAKVTASGRWYFHKDHLGSSTAITGEDGITVVESTEYMPFGGIRVHTGTVVSDYKYTDQEQDSETGLYNYNARLYDPIIGRFISADIIVQNFSDPQALNRYAYARNNPLIYSDPSGQFFGIDDLFRVVVGAIFGGVKALIEGKDVTQGMAAGAVSGLTFGIAGGIIRFAEITDPIIQSAIYAGTFAASKQISEAIVGSSPRSDAIYSGSSPHYSSHSLLLLFQPHNYPKSGFESAAEIMAPKPQRNANDLFDDISGFVRWQGANEMKWLMKAFSGSYLAATSGYKLELRALFFEVGGGVNTSWGKRVTPQGIVDFSEQSSELYFRAGPWKYSTQSGLKGTRSSYTVSNDLKVSISVAGSNPYTMTGYAGKLSLDLRSVVDWRVD